MKNYIFILTVLLASPWAMSQSDFKLDPATTEHIGNSLIECMYNYTINAPLKDSIDTTQKEVYTTILQANGSISKFWDWHTYKIDSITFTSHNSLEPVDRFGIMQKYEINVKHLFEPVVIKNYPQGKLTVTDNLIPDEYRYNENYQSINWALKNDTMTVCGYLCNKAVGSYGGREWTAWYTSEISISDGPWKLYGLPGLILKAEDTSFTHCFEAIAIRNSDSPLYQTKNPLQITIKREQFLKNKIYFEEHVDRILGQEVSQGRGMIIIHGNTENRRFTSIGSGRKAMRSRMSSKTVYSPLELE